MNIAFLYNLRRLKFKISDPRSFEEAEFDSPETVAAIKKILKELGHKVYAIEADETAYEKLKRRRKQIDLVFNIAEGIGGADREAHFPAILEMLNIPYTGPSPLSCALALNKVKTKEIWKYAGLPTPPWLAICSVKNLDSLKTANWNLYPAIIKPISEGSSKGIHASNLIRNLENLKRVGRETFRIIGRGGIMIEEYLTGREFTVAILGEPPRVLPIIEVSFDKLPAGVPRFDHAEAKWIYDNPESGYNPLICPAKLDAPLQKRIRETALKAFVSLEMADWARLDMRLDNKKIPQLLEINCPPGIIADPKENSRFPCAARAAGLSYKDMIREVIKAACRRWKIR